MYLNSEGANNLVLKILYLFHIAYFHFYIFLISVKSFRLYPEPINYSEVAGTHKEVKSGTVVTISCRITGITQLMTTVWKTSGQTDLISVSGYTVVEGNFDSSGGTQTTTLTLTGAVNNADKVYTCDVTPSGGTVQSTTVTLNVFGE